MFRPRIKKSALKTAWKMVNTIFARFPFSPAEKDLLLNCSTIVALQDLEGSRVEWRKHPERGLKLVFSGGAVGLESSGWRPGIRALYSEQEVEEAMDRAEGLFDRYGLDEEERAALFTALPCLGLNALGEFLEWTKKPPFPELV